MSRGIATPGKRSARAARLLACFGLGLALVALAFPQSGLAGECSATSGARRVPLLELYTSEGCDSCPPADRWIRGLPGRGLTPDRVVVLAFHVDYWNHLGWVDPYARTEFSERQRASARRGDARFVYTPQLLLNGKDYRRGLLRDDMPERVGSIGRESPAAVIRLNRRENGDETLGATATATVAEAAHRPGALLWLALYQNKLATQVLNGENRGKRLEHDFVVRELAGPYALDASGVVQGGHGFRLDRSWKGGELYLAAFVQLQGSGDVLQSLALAPCPRA